MIRRSSIQLLLAVLVGATVSCGSTAVTDRGALTQTSEEAALEAADGGLTSAPGRSRVGAPGSVEAAGGGAVGAGQSPAAGARGGGSIPGVVGDGSKEVRVGVYYASDAQENLSAIGAQSTAPNFRAASEVMVKDVNARGGVAKRRLVPIYHGFRSQSPDRAGEDQAACDDFTRDRPVMAVINIGSGSDILGECLHKAGIAYLYSGLTIDNDAVFRRHPLQSEPISISLDRLARVEVNGLAAQGFLRHAPGSQAAQLGRPVKLGVIAFDMPSFRDVFRRVLAPAYKAKGVPVSEVRFVRRETSGLGPDIDSAVLAFSQRGVTHVTFLTAGGLAPGLFIIRANSQRYEPRYGFSSQDAPQIVWGDNIRRISGDSAKSQYRGAVGVGWLPFGDVANATAPGIAPPSYSRCLELMRRGGLPPRDANYNGLLTYTCDGFWFLDAAFEAGGAAQLSPRSFITGQGRLGASYLPATITGTRVGPSRRDGVGWVRNFAFNDACSCFRYTSGKIAV